MSQPALTTVTIAKSSGRLKITCEDSPIGVVVSGLGEDSVCHQAGMHVGDIISAINGSPVSTHREAVRAIDTLGDVLTFVLKRPTRVVAVDKSQGRIGITLENYGHEVKVCALAEGSLTAQQILIGETILAINGTLVRTHAQAVKLIDCSPTPHVSFVLPATSREVVLDKASGRKVGAALGNALDSEGGVVVVGFEGEDTLAQQNLVVGERVFSVDGQLVHDHATAARLIDANPHSPRLVVGLPMPDVHALLQVVSEDEIILDLAPMVSRFASHDQLGIVGVTLLG